MARTLLRISAIATPLDRRWPARFGSRRVARACDRLARSTPLLRAAIAPHVVFGLAVGVGFLPFQHERSTVRPTAKITIVVA
jgi:hypothetical protein